MKSVNFKYTVSDSWHFGCYEYDFGDFFTIVAKDSNVLVTIASCHQGKNSGTPRTSWDYLISLARNHSHLKEKTVAELFKSSVQRQKLNDGSWRFSRSCRRTWIKLSSLFSPVAIEQRKSAEWRKLKVFQKVCIRLLSLTAQSTLFCLSLPSCWMS